MNKISGVVESKRRDGKAIQVEGKWFSIFMGDALDSVNKGDYVEFMYTEKANPAGGDSYKNIKGSVTKKTPPASTPMSAFPTTGAARAMYAKEFPVPPLHPDRSIIRQNSLSHATELVQYSGLGAGWSGLSGSDEDRDDYMAARVIRMARMFEAYSTGELDASIADEEVKKMLATDVSY